MNKNFKNMTIGAIASTIAGAYYLYGSPQGEARRKQVSAWAVKMKGEALDKIEKLKEISEPKYKEIVKTVSEKYKNVDKGELKKVVDDMYSTWNKMKKEVSAQVAAKAAQIAKEKNAMAKTKTVKAVSKKAGAVKVAVKKAVTKKVKVKTPAEKPVEVKIENTESK